MYKVRITCINISIATWKVHELEGKIPSICIVYIYLFALTLLYCKIIYVNYGLIVVLTHVFFFNKLKRDHV